MTNRKPRVSHKPKGLTAWVKKENVYFRSKQP